MNSFNKPIYNIPLDGEDQSKKRRVFSKLFTLDENSQYGFAMNRPLFIGIFKKEAHVNMDILNNSIKNFDPNAKIGEIFIIISGFTAYCDARKTMYNEIYPCILKPKGKVSTDRRVYRVYQLLSTMRMCKKENVLKFRAIGKSHATLSPKKRFFMYINHIHFLTKRAGWAVRNVYSYYTFEQETFKKEYILGNQRASQDAVARGDGVQGNFWKLLNNSNFGYDCRENLQNKSLHLIYDEEAEINFITKYDGNNSNCFLNLNTHVKNIEERYNDIENLAEDEQSSAETLKKAENKKVTGKFNKKKV